MTIEEDDDGRNTSCTDQGAQVQVIPSDPALALPASASTPPIDDNVQEMQASSETGGKDANTELEPQGKEATPSKRTLELVARPEASKTLPRRRRIRAEKSFIHDNSTSKLSGLCLPSSQYERILVRRAVRKDNNDQATPSPNQTPDIQSVGDVSLGMKLTVIAGKVIVQNVTCLADGRASPAQLAGSIRRGDVLLAINDYSLINLPFEQLMRGLSPLSTPNADGLYQRVLRLRFMAGDGMELLERNDAAKEAALEADQHANAANEMFGLFPMVDQLGGFHYGENDSISLSFSIPTAAVGQEPMEAVKENESNDHDTVGPLPSKFRPALDDRIGKDIATDRKKDKERFMSEFFSGSNGGSECLRPSDESVVGRQQRTEGASVRGSHTLSHPHVLERGKRALIGAKALSDRIESMDTGRNDVRSFKSWTTTISLYSRASARRKLVHDGASLPVNFGRLDEHEEEGTDHEEDDVEAKSVMSSVDNMDADELLVQLAAHDDIWRKQVIDFFAKYIKDLDEPENATQQAPEDDQNMADMDTALSNELGHFLFGDKMSRIIKKERRSVALPPDDVTLVLFDLTTKICATIPSQITGAVSARSNLTREIEPQSQKGSSSFLAKHFLLNDALPLWLQSFHPLPWEQRRILWPVDREHFGSSTTASTLSDDLSTDSMSASQRTHYLLQRKRKNLRERIEEKELNVETRTATCFLVTFYFVQQVIAQLSANQPCENTHPSYNDGAEDEAISFITQYGSYLKLYSCLVSVRSVECTRVSDVLLRLAKHDPRHKEVMKQLSKASSLVFYEPTMLSAVMQLLVSLRSHSMKDRRLPVVDLCVAAFPDISPGLVKNVCVGYATEMTIPDPSQLEFDDLYYIYLSQLLHPLDGHEMARRDSSLVDEWCRLSLHKEWSGTFKDRSYDRMANFLTVTSDRGAYNRDVESLLSMAMDRLLYNVALELAAEFVSADERSRDQEAMKVVLSHIRAIALNALDTGVAQHDQLRKVIAILKHASASAPMVSPPDEFADWIDHHSISSDRVLGVLKFLAEEASPDDVFVALLLWTEKSDRTSMPDLWPILRVLLPRAATASLGSGLSGSLLQIHQARQALTRSSQDATAPFDLIERGIWERMSNGDTSFCKW